MSAHELSQVWESSVEELNKEHETAEPQDIEAAAQDAENLFEAARW